MVLEKQALDMLSMNENTDNIFVAVYMITYNHERYIKQSVESVLSQQTNFKYKLFIGDDKSTDNTSIILEGLKNKFPEQIDYCLNEVNLGASINAIGMFKRCFESRAKYVAMLEGDDYWCDDSKLQKQVDFLEANDDYAICFHETTALRTEGDNHLMVNVPVDTTFELEDLLKKNFIPTASSLFRRMDFLNHLDARYTKISAGDWAIHLQMAHYGKIFYIKDNMAVYRIHAHGLWSSMNREKMVDKTILLMDELDAYFDYKYTQYFKQGKSELMVTYKSELAINIPPRPTLFLRFKQKIKRLFQLGNTIASF